METKEGHAYARYHARKHHAKKKGIEFTISYEYVVSLITEKCPILGIELSWCSQSVIVTDNSPSLDRVIPSLGYVDGNVVWVSSRANRIKNDGTQQEHEKIYKFMKGYSK